MALGVRLAERMAGWITFEESFDQLSEHPVEIGLEYPFEINLNAFTSRFLCFPWRLPFRGYAKFPGLPLHNSLPESATRPSINGELEINPLKGVAYDWILEIERVGQLRFKGAKRYAFFTLSWKKFRSSLVTLPFEVLDRNHRRIGRGQLAYLKKLWEFPGGLSLTRSKWAYHPRRKLAIRIARFSPVISPTRSYDHEKLLSSIERLLGDMPPLFLWFTQICIFILTLFSLFRWGRTPSKLIPTQLESLSRLMATHSLLYFLGLPITTALAAALYSDDSFLEENRQHRPLPPKNVEEERWMSLNQTPHRGLANEVIEVDVVVVGSGAGGGAAAYELAKQGHAVAVVEEGHYFKRADMIGRNFEMMTRLYREQGHTFAIANAPLWIPTGCCVGGTTTINCGTSIRTPSEVLARWKEMGIELDLPSYFQEVEEMLDVKTVPSNLFGGVDEVLRRGLKGKPYTFHPLPRGETSCDGQSFCAFGCPTGAKRSVDVSYLPEAMKRNAFLFTHYTVDKLEFENGRAVGVRAHLKNYKEFFPITFRAKRVLLAAGSLATPHLLWKSGFKRSLSQLGENLTIHPALNFAGLFPYRTREKMFVPQALGVFDLPTNDFVLEGYTFSIEALPTALGLYGERLQEIIDHLDFFASFSALIRDCTKGSLLFRKAKAIPKYYIDRRTREICKEATLLMSEIFFDAQARRVFTPIRGFESLSQRDDLLRLKKSSPSAQKYTLSAHHPLGTCQMGTSPDNSVVDAMGKVWGIDALYIVDGSTIPGPIGVNPQVTIMANAIRIAREIGKSL